MNNARYLVTAIFIVVFAFATADLSEAQSTRRDYMTDEEIELVRDAQDIDARIDVLIKMIDRRFVALNVNAGGAAVPNKETSKWGAAPKGSRIELLDDIRRLLDKAIGDIDNVAAHPVNYDADKDRSEKEKKRDSQRFPSSVRALALAAKRFQPALKTLLDKSTDEKERGLILESLESCDEIVAAAANKLSG
jgi:hypothetical protein